MGKHSIVTQTQGFIGTPAFRAIATATAAGSFFGIGTTVAVAAPQADNSIVRAPKAVAATVNLAADTDAKAAAEAAAESSQTSSGWTFNVATAEVKEAPAQSESAQAKAESTFTYQPVPDNGTLGERIVGTARQGIGVPYVWGGSTPAGWDCSGFVMWTLGQLGISVSHGADSIAAQFTQIPASEAQPGDLVWWPGQHIAVYAGDGMIIGAQDYGIGTVHTPLYGSYSFVRVS